MTSNRVATLVPILLLAAAPGVARQLPGQGDESGLFLVDRRQRVCAEPDPAAGGGSGLFLLRSARTICRGQWLFALYLTEWDRRVTGIEGRDARWNDWDLDWVRGSIAIGYGLTETIELSLSLPYDVYEGSGLVEVVRGERLVQGGRLHGREFFEEIDVEGLGNLRFGTKWRVRETQARAMAFHAFVDLPTGNDDDAVVTGDLGVGLGLDWSLGDWIVNVGYFDPGDPDRGEESAQLQLGIGYRRRLGDRLEWITELASAGKIDGGEEHGDTDITSGVRLRLGGTARWALNLALRLDVSDAMNTGEQYNPIGWLVGLTWAQTRWKRLTLETAGSCAGTIVRHPPPALCGREEEPRYRCGETVRLTAVPDDEDLCAFTGWSGDCAGSDPILDLSMERDATCTAVFETVGGDQPAGAPDGGPR